jgi:hypothetical protein
MIDCQSLKERELTNRKQRCILTDIRKAKQLFSECNRMLKYNIIAVTYLIHIQEVLNSVVGRLLTVLDGIFLLLSPSSADK